MSWRTCCGSGRCRRPTSPPPDLRELRELVRHRRQLVKVRTTSVKAGMRALLAKHNDPTWPRAVGPGHRTGLLDALVLPEPYAPRLASQRRLLLVLADEIDLGRGSSMHDRLRRRPGLPDAAEGQRDRPDLGRGVRRRDR